MPKKYPLIFRLYGKLYRICLNKIYEVYPNGKVKPKLKVIKGGKS